MDGSAAQVDSSALTLSASPVYVELVTDINGDIGVIGTKMAELRAAHEARLRITFDPAAEEQKEREVQILTNEITRYFNAVGGKLKRLANFDSGAEEAEIKLRKNIQRGLATRLHDLSTEFRWVVARRGADCAHSEDAMCRAAATPVPLSPSCL
jgi:leucyl aminopeptidase (aminopeptidase T)